MAWTESKDSATVRGTGRLRRTSLCRHFARLPWVGGDIGEVGVISVTWGLSSLGFCTAAPFLWAQNTAAAPSGKMGKRRG
ncbi:hypothetical protein [Ponticoccus litoralis]|uniref:Uncharacterized protein n=1 Tax=Ponticoccus litoralis TaxID=422297 RepID=A0AAW9SIA3_9RHOB